MLTILDGTVKFLQAQVVCQWKFLSCIKNSEFCGENIQNILMSLFSKHLICINAC